MAMVADMPQDASDMRTSVDAGADMAVTEEDMMRPAVDMNGACQPGDCVAGFSCPAQGDGECQWPGGAATFAPGSGVDVIPPASEVPDEVDGPVEPLGVLRDAMRDDIVVSACEDGTVPVGVELGFGESDRDGIKDHLLKLRLICQTLHFPEPAIGAVAEPTGSQSLATNFDFGTALVFAEFLCEPGEVLVGAEAKTFNTDFRAHDMRFSCGQVYISGTGAPAIRDVYVSPWLDDGGCEFALDDAFDTDATRCVTRGSQTCAREDHFLFEVHAIREESIDRDHASAWQATCRPAGLMR